MSPLHYACKANNFDIVGILLRHKANIKLTDNAGRTPLHVICERCKILWSLRPSDYPDIHVSRSNTESKSIVKSLIDFDADVNARDKFGESPLHKTCKYEDYELVKMLLSLKQSDINLQNIWGQTPLHLACDCGYENIVQLLLTEKLIVLKTDGQGKSPLDVSLEILKRIKDNLAYYIWLDNCDTCDIALYDESLESSSFNYYLNIVNLLTEDNADISKS
ncbi:ankyrin repeat domain-containing protein 27-like [Mytilus trossulus]|uniref:ankyrin repeat domain-containing protein 27-like n=1 Tax=Mytilus trossulus TaxID=6551 RepID=UPI003004B857